MSESSELATEVASSNSSAEVATTSLSPERGNEVEKKESRDTSAVKRGGFNKSKLSPRPTQTPPTPAKKSEAKGYLKFLFTLNLFAWDIILFKNSVRTVLIIGAIVFAIILAFYPLLHCLVLILLLSFAASIFYSLMLLLFRIIVGKPATHPFRHWLSQTESHQIDPAWIESLTRGVLEVVAPLFNSVLRLVLFYDLRISVAGCLLLYLISYLTVYITLPYILSAALLTAFVAPKLYSLTQESVDSLIGRMLDKYKRVAAKIEKVVDTE